MQQPSVSRAIPMGIIGFILGALLVILIRNLQGLDPVWSPGMGIISGVLNAAVLFIWGIGGFDSRWSVHGEGHEEDEPAHVGDTANDPQTVRSLFTSSFWQVALLLLLSIVGIAILSALGPALTTTQDPLANPRAVGYFPVTWFGQDLFISEIVVFAALIIFMLVSLALFGAGLAWLLTFLSRGVKEAQVEAASANALASGRSAPPVAALASGGIASTETVTPARTPNPLFRRIRTITVFVVTFVILYLLFYYVLIGLILPMPAGTLTIISAINALIFTFVILRTGWVLNLVGRFAGWLARVVRGTPGVFQK